jgi:Mg2+ and Co2+ transporter CorA
VTLGLLEKNGDGELRRQELDVLVGRNLVVTVHEGAIAAIDAFEEELSYERGLGELDAGAFMTGLVDAVLSTYFREIDEIDMQIERLDQLAFRSKAGDEFLAEVVRLRRRIAQVRRALVPNREALGPLVRPDFEVHEDLVRAWPGTSDRLERAIDSIEKSRELLVGSFDIYLGRASQRSNDVMKLLTVLSAIALPPIVLAGVMGMNFQIPFFEAPGNFFFVVGAMLIFAVGIIVIAKVRDWI